jgi:hypothetical protein
MVTSLPGMPVTLATMLKPSALSLFTIFVPAVRVTHAMPPMLSSKPSNNRWSARR